MKANRWIPRTGRTAFLLLVLLVFATPAAAAVYDLTARAGVVSVPTGAGTVEIPIWGFALGADPASIPGPVLSVPPGEDLTVNLTNELPVEVSIVIPGQQGALSPVYNAEGRVTSFVETVPALVPGGTPATKTYTWPNPKPGTYLYHSGTHPAVQVQMGLYGAVKADAAAGMAYPGQAYDNEAILVLSEIDPLIHRSVAEGKYGRTAPADATPEEAALYITSTIDYAPRFFLLNGKTFPEATALLDHPPAAGERLLLRFLNAGLESHHPVLREGYMQVIAENGFPLAHPKPRYGVFLGAQMTADGLLTVADPGGRILYDHMLHLSNGAEMPEGGLLTGITVNAPTTGAMP